VHIASVFHGVGRARGCCFAEEEVATGGSVPQPGGASHGFAPELNGPYPPQGTHQGWQADLNGPTLSP